LTSTLKIQKYIIEKTILTNVLLLCYIKTRLFGTKLPEFKIHLHEDPRKLATINQSLKDENIAFSSV